MRPIAALLLLLAVALTAWNSKIHSGIIHSTLMAIPPEDRIQERWGGEIWRLIFVRFIVKGQHEPGSALREIFIQAEHP